MFAVKSGAESMDVAAFGISVPKDYRYASGEEEKE